MLGAAYLLGAGVPRDGVAALAWLLRAQRGGSALADAVPQKRPRRIVGRRNRRSGAPRRVASAGASAMIVGTAGHVDHGKTALVRALTGVDTDRLKEEKARGITIDLGFAYLQAPDGKVLGFIDVPGHEKFVHNMLAGAGSIDFVLLVVAADDGVMPQTREHLAIVDLLGVHRGIVAMTKVDLVSIERREAVRTEIARTLHGTGLAGCDVVPVSIVSGEGVASLCARLFAARSGRQARPSKRAVSACR